MDCALRWIEIAFKLGENRKNIFTEIELATEDFESTKTQMINLKQIIQTYEDAGDIQTLDLYQVQVDIQQIYFLLKQKQKALLLSAIKSCILSLNDIGNSFGCDSQDAYGHLVSEAQRAVSETDLVKIYALQDWTQKLTNAIDTCISRLSNNHH